MATLADYLEQYLTPERKQRMEGVMALRTRYLSVLVEDLFQPHNASAVLRTADALGIQDVHVVEQKNAFRANDEIALGSSQWLTTTVWKGESAVTDACRSLRRKGYRIVATTPHTRSCSLDGLDLAKGRVVLLFGTELTGLSQAALDEADEYVHLPMYGFVESFNISVTAALCMHHLGEKLRHSTIPWQLANEERDVLWLDWLRRSIKSAPALERRYLDGLAGSQ